MCFILQILQYGVLAGSIVVTAEQLAAGQLATWACSHGEAEAAAVRKDKWRPS